NHRRFLASSVLRDDALWPEASHEAHIGHRRAGRERCYDSVVDGGARPTAPSAVSFLSSPTTTAERCLRQDPRDWPWCSANCHRGPGCSPSAALPDNDLYSSIPRPMTPAWRGAWASPRYDQAMNLLRKLRQQKGWTQEHLALVAGIGKRTIQRLERGTVKPTPETAMALANALDVEPDRILNWAGLRSHLRLCLVTWSRRWPEAEELAALPPNLRALFTTFHENRASLAADQQRLSELDAKANAVHELFMEL